MDEWLHYDDCLIENLPDKQDGNASVVLSAHKAKIILEIVQARLGNGVSIKL